MIVIEIAERLECGELAPLFFSFPGTKSGAGSPHSKRSADLFYLRASFYVVYPLR